MAKARPVPAPAEEPTVTAPDTPSAPPYGGADSLLGLLDRLTADDLADLNTRIAAKRGELAALVSARKLVADRLGVATRKPPTRKAAPAARPAAPTGEAAEGGSVGQARRVAVAKLLGTRGPLAAAAICEECDIPAGSITYTLTHPWFEKDMAKGTWKLTPRGRAEAIGG